MSSKMVTSAKSPHPNLLPQAGEGAATPPAVSRRSLRRDGVEPGDLEGARGDRRGFEHPALGLVDQRRELALLAAGKAVALEQLRPAREDHLAVRIGDVLLDAQIEAERALTEDELYAMPLNELARRARGW